ncbi:hypothetical protein JTB14_035773 [Gonioctena quinquepunctata]|nr:hypothetical protein JTB14_035773 [Gonioctena quinquepunctata]
MSMTHEPLRYAHDEGHTDVCYSEDGSNFVTCGADGDIRIWSCDEGEDPVHNCVGEWALCIRQKGNSLYVATGSNDIQILSLPEGDRDGVLDRFVAPINHIAVEKDSQLIALAGEDMEVKLIDLDRSDKEVKKFEGLLGPCLSVAITSKSKMVAAASGDTKLRIWDIETGALLKEISCFPRVNSFSNAKVLCRIDFDPTSGKKLAYPANNTVIILNVSDWLVDATLTCGEVSSHYSIVQYSPCGKYILASSDKGDFVIWDVNSQNVSIVSKHEKSVAICGLMWNPKGNGEIIYTDIEGQLGIISKSIKCLAENEPGLEPVENGHLEDNDVDFTGIQFEEDDEDNENAISLEQIKKPYIDIDESSDDELKHLRPLFDAPPTPQPHREVPLQEPFIPTSTPELLDPRYLCWNEVGIIRSYGHNSDETGTRSIEVEFHDSTFHNSMMMQNYHDYSMASLSKTAFLVASPCQFTVIPLAASSKEWNLKLIATEEIMVVAASESLICIGLANYIVRICSVYGTQRAVISIPGPILSMAAFKNLLMVAYHHAAVSNGDQSVSIKLYKFEGTSMDCKDIGSALSPESKLRWLGFSDVGTPAMMDSTGFLCLYPHNCNTWIPFCDTSKYNKGESDGFFVTAVFESYQAIGGIKCRGSQYPGFTPRPTMCEIPLEPPFAEDATEKTQMEMNLFTWSTLQISDIDKKFKETAVKTFALACRNNLDERALELMEFLSNPQLIALSLKYASKLDKRRLVEKLTDLAARITDENEDLGVKELPITDDKNVKPAYRKLSLNLSRNTPKNKLEKLKEIQSTPGGSQTTQNTVVSTPNSTMSDGTLNVTGNTQDSSLLGEIKPNPFLKSLKKSKVSKEGNPLSLTDKFAGVSYDKETKENKAKNGETGEKRKKSDYDSEKQKGKQMRLEGFRFKSN